MILIVPRHALLATLARSQPSGYLPSPHVDIQPSQAQQLPKASKKRQKRERTRAEQDDNDGGRHHGGCLPTEPVFFKTREFEKKFVGWRTALPSKTYLSDDYCFAETD